MQFNSPNQILQVTNEPVHVALAGRLMDDVLVVIVAQAAAQLLVVHLWLVLANAPSTGHLLEQHTKQQMFSTCSVQQPKYQPNTHLKHLPHPDR